MLSGILRFTTNIPEEVALRFPDGKQVPSRIEGAPDQMMYSLVGDRVMYVPLRVAERIRELQIQPGQRFEVCKAELKNGNRRGIEWQVKRVDPDLRCQDATGKPLPARPEPAAPPHANGNGAAAPVRNTGSDPGNGQSTTKPANGNGTVNGHATHNGIPYWDARTELLRCYDEAIAVLVTARDHAASQGLPVQFTGEDLRQVAATLYIDAGKDRRCPNGGLR